MDPSRVRAQVVKNLLTGPWTVTAGGMGAILLLLACLLGNPSGSLGVVGLAAIVVAMAAAAGQWFFRYDRLAREALDDLRKEEERRRFTHLRQLQRQLRGDRDLRTGQFIVDLRRLCRRLERASPPHAARRGSLLLELRDQAEELYGLCVASLERSLELSITAQDLATPEARGQVLESRESLLGEIEKSVARLDATLDYLQAAAVGRDEPEERLVRVREELEVGLDVARRVRQQMDELDQSLRQIEAGH